MRIMQGQLDESRQERDTFKEQTRLLTQELERTESALTKQQVATDAMREIFHAELTETQTKLQQTEAKLSARKNDMESENREKQITASESEDRDNSALHHSTISKDTGDESVQADDTSVSETKPTDVSDDMFVGMATDEQTTIHIDKEDYGGFASDHGASTGSVGTAAEGNWKMKLLEGHPSQPGQVFIKATGVAFHGDQLMVCYPDNHIIQILDKDYAFLRVIGSFTGQFTKPFRPLDVAIAHSNLIFINERGNSQVVVCDESNTVVRVISPLKEVSIYGIALMLRYLLLTDVKGHRLLKYTQDGEYVSEVGSKGSGNTEFDWPWSVVVNSNNVIMVSDCHNHCIKCFDSSLQFLYKLGTPGSGDGQLDWPCSIAVDKDDNVYVCDGSNDRIVKWRSDGKWICNLFQGEVQNPLHIAVTADRIAITEVKSNTVKVFYL
ncbi:tripartite motif-containing protein 2-like [Ptychodera flava]|uniref:tripartite motif-containing protein 2-like n=1 Tax=Ptychodera flava TaxID=63121 RepID=UPI00396A015D